MATYTIPTTQREAVEKAVARIQKKASKYGKQFVVEYGEVKAMEVPVRAVDEINNCIVNKGTELVEVFDLTIEGEIIRKDGYTVVAQIEHFEEGNVVNAFEGQVKPEWIHSDCRCEHCKTNRARAKTFIVRGEDGSELQVGRSCLKDYCGINPQEIGYRNELVEILEENDIERFDFGKGYAHAYNAVEVLATAIKVYKAQGYVKSSEPNSNRSKIPGYLREVTEDEMKEAEEMAKVIKDLSDADAINFLLNDTRSLIRTEYCKDSHFGYLAYAPVAFEKYTEAMKRKAEKEAKHEAETASEYVGEVGKRQTFEIADYKLVTSWEGQYGTTYLYKFTDTNGNVLVWFASGCFGHWIEVDGVCKFIEEENITRIKATVKDHNERDGVKQTIINRVKVA